MMTQNYKIKLLNDCQEHIPSLAKLWFEEISQHWVPDASTEKAEQKLIAHLNSDTLPMAFVAHLRRKISFDITGFELKS